MPRRAGKLPRFFPPPQKARPSTGPSSSRTFPRHRILKPGGGKGPRAARPGQTERETLAAFQYVQSLRGERPRPLAAPRHFHTRSHSIYIHFLSFYNRTVVFFDIAYRSDRIFAFFRRSVVEIFVVFVRVCKFFEGFVPAPVEVFGEFDCLIYSILCLYKCSI